MVAQQKNLLRPCCAQCCAFGPENALIRAFSSLDRLCGRRSKRRSTARSEMLRPAAVGVERERKFYQRKRENVFVLRRFFSERSGGERFSFGAARRACCVRLSGFVLPVTI